jgi:DNA-binding transcriptional regulator of glucitol operon
MKLKNNNLTFKNIKFAVLVIAILTACDIGWWQYNLHQQSQEVKVKAERERISRVLRESGLAVQKAWLAQGKPVMQEDELAPQELSDEGELAQAKLWQSLSKDKREIMRTETINAGLATASKEQLPPD